VITEVPLVDMLGLDESPAGEALTAEYGSPTESKPMFDILHGYSPLHNVKTRGQTPPQLIVAAEKDANAAPGQIYKYVAARQTVAKTDQPVLLRIVYGEGHGDWSWPATCQNLAEEMAFLKSILMRGD
jgi:prolyl oligopeptidase